MYIYILYIYKGTTDVSGYKDIFHDICCLFSQEQQTPLHIAARMGNVDNVLLLLQHGADPEAVTKDGYTPLHIAAKEGHEEVIGVLIDQSAAPNSVTKVKFYIITMFMMELFYLV